MIEKVNSETAVNLAGCPPVRRFAIIFLKKTLFFFTFFHKDS